MSESHKLVKQINVDFELLDRLLTRYSELIQKCSQVPPSDIELDALAAMLHSFYSGIENIFKRIHVILEGRLHKGEAWHTQLLDSMTQATTQRSAVISESTRIILHSYLTFRHRFRFSYLQELNWTFMKPMVLDVPSTLDRVRAEVLGFIESR